jgi:DNA-binding response OmpR family regulator
MTEFGRPELQDSFIRKTILVGIADAATRMKVARGLSELDCEVITVVDGYRLLERLGDAILDLKHRATLRLVVADTSLAGCSGLNLLTGLRELGWDIPIVLLTRSAEEDERRKAWDAGVTGVFIEPYELRELCVFAELVLDSRVGAAIRAARTPKNDWLHASQPTTQAFVRFGERPARFR